MKKLCPDNLLKFSKESNWQVINLALHGLFESGSFRRGNAIKTHFSGASLELLCCMTKLHQKIVSLSSVILVKWIRFKGQKYGCHV